MQTRKPLSLLLFSSVLEILELKKLRKQNKLDIDNFKTRGNIIICTYYDCILGKDTGEFTEKLLQAEI